MNVLKNILSFGLAVLFVLGSVHVNFHHSYQPDGYSICDVECKDESHHYSIHKCEQCLNRNQKIVYPTVSVVTYSEVGLTVKTLKTYLTESPIPFSLYSRPPPRIHSI